MSITVPAISNEIQPQKKVWVADVAIDARLGGAEAIYTYKMVSPVGLGQGVFVPLGRRTTLGFVIAHREVEPETLGFALRPLGTPVEGLFIPPQTLNLLHFVSREYLCGLPQALSLALPPGVRDRLVTAWHLLKLPEEDKPFSATQKEVLRVLAETESELLENPKKPLATSTLRALRHLEIKGYVSRRLSLAAPAEKHRLVGLLRLTPDEDKIQKFLSKEGKTKPAQAITLMRLQGAGPSSFTPLEIKALCGVTDQTLRALLTAGLLERAPEYSPTPRTPPTPNPDQGTAIEAIVQAIRSQKAERFLLFGVTGSGKTEVYLRAAAEALKQGKQVLYLVPEIALTAQVVAQLRERFGRAVALLHSALPASERLDAWIRVQTGQAALILGARSALFAPFQNLGLIIVDEEHEASYKQENVPRYQAKQLAQFLAEAFQAPLVLGSATPSLESYAAAQEDKITLLKLPIRAASAKLPKIDIEDLSEGYREGKPALFTDHLRQRLQETLQRGEQAILFLNRRGFAPFLLCRECGHSFACPHCAVSLTYHKGERRLRCHHCGFHRALPDTCPECQSKKIAPFGAGSEKVEEAVSIEFPGITVLRLDRDVARRKGALDQTFALFRSGAVQVLVGTQMVAKGLDFPGVTLVGVIAADIALNLPDFRASERTFQLLSQVSGRAGRGQIPGHVVIQTFNPGHRAVLAAQNHDAEGFFEAELAERRSARYPPFVRLVNVVVSGLDREEVVSLCQQVREKLVAALPEAEILGPVDCPLERLQGHWRRHVLVKLQPGGSAEPLGKILEGLETKKTRVTIDVDPQSLA